MAKRTKRGHSSHRRTGRGRRIGAMSSQVSESLKMVVGGIAGYAIGSIASSKLATMSPTIKGAVLTVGGVIILRKSGNGLMRGLGVGLGVSGGQQLLSSFGVLNGIGMGAQNLFLPASTGRRLMNGFGNGVSQSVSGAGINAKVSGGNVPSNNMSNWAAFMPG